MLWMCGQRKASVHARSLAARETIWGVRVSSRTGGGWRLKQFVMCDTALTMSFVRVLCHTWTTASAPPPRPTLVLRTPPPPLLLLLLLRLPLLLAGRQSVGVCLTFVFGQARAAATAAATAAIVAAVAAVAAGRH